MLNLMHMLSTLFAQLHFWRAHCSSTAVFPVFQKLLTRTLDSMNKNIKRHFHVGGRVCILVAMPKPSKCHKANVKKLQMLSVTSISFVLCCLECLAMFSELLVTNRTCISSSERFLIVLNGRKNCLEYEIMETVKKRFL